MHVSDQSTSWAKKKNFETSKLYTILSNETKYIWVGIFIKKNIYKYTCLNTELICYQNPFKTLGLLTLVYYCLYTFFRHLYLIKAFGECLPHPGLIFVLYWKKNSKPIKAHRKEVMSTKWWNWLWLFTDYSKNT